MYMKFMQWASDRPARTTPHWDLWGTASSDSEEVGDVTALLERSLGIILSSSKVGVG